MVLDWGMSDKLGLVRYAPDERAFMLPDMGGKDYSDRTAQTIDEEIKALIDKAMADTRDLLNANRDRLQRVAQALMRYETLSVDDVQALLDGRGLDKPTVGDLLDREHAKSKGVTLNSSAAQPDETPPQP
jgi:cell division protease FtsH